MNPMTEPGADHLTAVADRPGGHVVPSPDSLPVEDDGAEPTLAGRLLKGLLVLAVVTCGVLFALYKMRPNVPALNTPGLYAHLDSMVERAEHWKARYGSFLHKPEEEAHHEQHKVVLTSPMARDVIITQEYVCQIHSRRHIDVCALEDGYLQAIPIKEGQSVKKDDLMFEVVPTLFKAKWDAQRAERDLAKLELDYSRRLASQNGVSRNEVALYEAKLAKAQAEADRAEAEYNFTKVRARFDGLVDRLKQQEGSLVKEGDVLTTLSDNEVMWVYFNVTEKRYLQYMAETGRNKLNLDVTLMLADFSKFPHMGKIDQARRIGAIEANFNNETGNIAFRADFPNPDGLLRHGQTGTVLIRQPLKGALVIPQRATFENLAKRYVYLVGKDDMVRQHEIVIEHELEDIFVIRKTIDVSDRIVLEGTRQVHDGQKVDGYEFLAPDEAMANQKNHAE